MLGSLRSSSQALIFRYFQIRFIVLALVFLFTGCAAMRPPAYQPPEDGKIAWVIFVNASPITTGIHIYEDARACGQKKSAFFVGGNKAFKIKIKGNVPFTYSQDWERMNVQNTQIDTLDMVHADIGYIGCRVMNTFLPEANESYILGFEIIDSYECKYSIYNEKFKQKMKVYERQFVMPTWETGNFCEPVDLRF